MLSSVTHIRVAVGSKNPTKIDAVEEALPRIIEAWTRSNNDVHFSQTRPSKVSFSVCGFDVPSEVAGQPFSEKECITGAQNRAKSAIKELMKQVIVSSTLSFRLTHPGQGECSAGEAFFGVGIEGGVRYVEVAGMWMEAAWVAVVDAEVGPHYLSLSIVDGFM